MYCRGRLYAATRRDDRNRIGARLSVDAHRDDHLGSTIAGGGDDAERELMVEPDGRPEADKYTLSSKPQQLVVVKVPVA